MSCCHAAGQVCSECAQSTVDRLLGYRESLADMLQEVQKELCLAWCFNPKGDMPSEHDDVCCRARAVLRTKAGRQ